MKKNIPFFRNHNKKNNKWYCLLLFTLLQTFAMAQTITPVKTVTSTSSCGVIDVALTISGTGTISNSDVVLVIDVSASMNNTILGDTNKPMYYAKQAAKSFIDAASVNPNNRIAIVSYTTRAAKIIGLTDLDATGIASLKTTIDNLTAKDYTNIQDGIVKANDELNSNGRKDCKTTRSIVLLTDGVTNRSGETGGNNCGTDAPNFPATTSCINQAITAATTAKNASNQIFTIGLFGGLTKKNKGVTTADENARSVARATLKNIQSAGDSYYFETLSSANLTAIYTQIANQLNWVAKDFLITETIPAGYGISDITSSSGNLSTPSLPAAGPAIITLTNPFLTTAPITLNYKLTPDGSKCGNQKVSSTTYCYVNSSCSRIIHQPILTPDYFIDCKPAIVGSPSVCTGTNGSVYSVPNIIGHSYSWNIIGGTITAGQNTNSITVNWGIAGSGKIEVTETISSCPLIATLNVAINPLPIVCAGTPFTKTCCSNTTGGIIGEKPVAGFTYEWTSLPLGFTSADANPTVNPSVTTTYTVTKTNNSTGCSDSQSVVVTVDDAIPSLIVSNPIPVCSPETVDITTSIIQTTNNGKTTKYYTTLESANAGGISDLTAPTAITSSGTYYIRSEFANGCFIVKPVIVSVNSCSIALVKESKLHNTGSCTKVNDKVTYNFLVSNPGTSPIANIAITDPLLASPNSIVPILYASGDTNADGFLNSNEIWKYSADYSITQSDITSGQITNQANVNGIVLGTKNVNTVSGTNLANNNPTITELCQNPKIAITKDGIYVDSNGDGITNIGDIITYNFVVTNTGNVPLTAVTVTDDNAIISGGQIDFLAVRDTDSTTFTGSHTITQEEINIGYVYNLALVTGKDPKGNDVTDYSTDPTPCTTCPPKADCPDCTIVILESSPSLSVIKTATTESYSKVGDLINYTIIVKNTGNQTLHQVIVKDPLTGLDTVIALLEPDAQQEYTQNYTVIQEDLNRGSVLNVATANGLTPNNTPISDDDDEIVNEKTNPIDAVDDNAGTIVGVNQITPNVINVFNNDTLNGLPINPDEVILTTVTSNPYLQMNSDGSIDVLADAPPGTQTMTYQICEKLNDTNCDTATVTTTIICSNTTKITGIIYNEATNTPLANVPVTLIPQGTTTGSILIRITNTQGYYNFAGMAEGEYLVQVQDANLNGAYQLYPVNSSLFFTTIESCKFQTHDFGYDKSDLPVLGDFVWYDVNNDGIQNEWFDANNDNLVTQNIPDANGSFDYSKWEWIDLNGDGNYTGPLNAGELNAAGFGNSKSSNLFVSGPNSYSDSVIIGVQGFWRNRPDAGLYGDYQVELRMDPNLEAQSSAMGATGLVKVLPNSNKIFKAAKTGKSERFEVCGPTNQNPQIASVTETNQVHLDIDFGISCKMFANIQATDDTYNVTQCSILDGIRNALSNDLLNGQTTTNLNDFKFKLLTNLDQYIDIKEDGSIAFAEGVMTGEYTFEYEVCEAINPNNCDTATITINIAGIDPITISSDACNTDSTPIELNSLLPEGSPTNGTWIDTDGTGRLIGTVLNAIDLPVNTYQFEYKIEGNCPRSIFVMMEINEDCKVLPCKTIVVHNAVSANEDGKNDYFEIENLENNECYKNFTVKIFNRWGVLVFERENYDNDGNAFRGRSEGRTTINKNEGLPAGTYFYVLLYDTVDGEGRTQNIKKDGYLYLVK